MAEGFNRPKEIFLKALDITSSDARFVFLAEACGGDTALREQIEALLEAHAQRDSFLEKPAAALGVTIDATTDSSAAPADLLLGTRIGPYKLREQIGAGGMGVVYVAEQQEPVRRNVALKIIRPGMDSAQVLARFEAERQALALMDHPNIARVLDAGTTPEGRPYFVMELVKGVPITQYCDERRLTLRQRLELFIPVCQAVQHAHQKAIIHRDLKPSNILIALYDGKPVPKVIDFGVAKAMGEQLTDRSIYTGFGAIVGTLAYMSPEQAELNQIDIDTRSDIYSLGVVLYELLTGSTPIDRQRLKEGAILEVLRMIREEEPTPPSRCISTSSTLVTLSAQRQTEPARLASLVRGDVDWIVMKALDKDRGRRYETANSLAADIERYLKDLPVEAGPPGIGYRLRKFVKRNRSAVLAASLLLVTLVAGITGTTWGLFEARWERDEAVQARLDEATQRKRAVDNEARAIAAEGRAKNALAEAEQSAKEEKRARELSEENEKTAKFQALRAETARYAMQIDLAWRRWQDRQIPWALVTLSEVAEQFRDTWEYRHMVSLCRRKAIRLGNGDRINAVAFSPDGRYLASADLYVSSDHDTRVKIWDGVTGKEIRTIKHPGNVRWLAFSDDGKQLATLCHDVPPAGTNHQYLKVWDTGSGKEIFGKILLPGTHAAFSPNGKYLAASDGPKGAILWDAATGQVKRVLGAKLNPSIECLAFSHDGKRLAMGTYHVRPAEALVLVFDTESGQEKLRFFHSSKQLAFHPDGKRLLCSGASGTKVWDVESGKELLECKARPLHHAREATFSADGKHIVVIHEFGVSLWDASSGQEQPVDIPRDQVSCSALSPDGKRIAVGQVGLFIWQLANVPYEADLPPMGPMSPHHQPIVLSQDAQHVFAAVGPPKQCDINCWNTNTGKLKFSVRARSFVYRMALSGDGKLLAVADRDHDPNSPNTDAIMILDAETGKEQLCLSGAKHRVVSGLAFSPDAKRLLITGGGVAKLWDVTMKKELFSLSCVGAAFSPDGLRLVTRIATIDTHDGLRKATPEEESTATTRNALTGAEELKLRHGKRVDEMLFSHDGKLVYTFSWEGRTCKVWDAHTGAEKLSFPLHFGHPGPPRLSPDGKRITVLGGMHDTATGQLVFHAPAAALGFSPDGKRLYYADDRDFMLKILEAP